MMYSLRIQICRKTGISPIINLGMGLDSYGYDILFFHVSILNVFEYVFRFCN